VRRRRRQVAVGKLGRGRPRRAQIFVEIRFLIREIQRDPLREDLVMMVAERAVGDLAPGGFDQ
jgi:hypothetical protein